MVQLSLSLFSFSFATLHHYYRCLSLFENILNGILHFNFNSGLLILSIQANYPMVVPCPCYTLDFLSSIQGIIYPTLICHIWNTITYEATDQSVNFHQLFVINRLISSYPWYRAACSHYLNYKPMDEIWVDLTSKPQTNLKVTKIIRK